VKLKFKLDENISYQLQDIFKTANYEVSTVKAENLAGSPDSKLAEVCRMERKCLITLDDGFSQILQYPPQHYAGIIVLRHPRPTLSSIRDLLSQIIDQISPENILGKLWIVEPGRIRVHDGTSL
jgi:predicted nuclease of predicted toxin-antitoxin system